MFDLLINEKKFNSLQDCKRHFFPQKYKISLGKWNYEVTWKKSEGNGIKRWISSIKFLVNMKNGPFIFSKKTEETFWPMQYMKKELYL